MDLLKEVPSSVLWLMKLNDGAHVNLTNSAKEHGVDPSRIVYASRVPRPEDHLARYRLANLFLDTFPYNGHTTAGDALRAGIPVVSINGNTFASRVATSLLHDLSMSQYACSTTAAYQALALRIVSNDIERSHIKNHLGQITRNSQWPLAEEIQSRALLSSLNEILLDQK